MQFNKYGPADTEWVDVDDLKNIPFGARKIRADNFLNRVEDYLAEGLHSELDATYASLDGLGVIQAIDYGIVADGLFDNTAVLNTLMTDVSAGGGGNIALPAGVIRTTTALIQQSNIHMSGAGQEVTIIKPEQHGFFRNATAINPIFNFHLSSLTIDGANRAGLQPTWKGYHGQYHRRCSWQNLNVRNTGMTGLGPDFLDDCVMFNCLTEDTGLENDGATPSGNGIGIGAGGAQGTPEWPAESFTIIGCTAKRAKRFGIMYEGGISPQSVKIIGCTATGSEAGFDISGGTGAILTGNNAYENGGPGFHVGTATLDSSLAGQHGRISDNFAHRNGGSGILYEARIHAPAGPGFAITDNTCTENTGYGIEVDTTTADLRGLDISSNTLLGNTGEGISLNGSSIYKLQACKVDDNLLIDNNGTTSQLNVGVDTEACSISGNQFHRRSGLGTGLNFSFGLGGVARDHIGLKVHGNTAYGLTLFNIYPPTGLTECSFKDNIGLDVAPIEVRSDTTVGERLFITESTGVEHRIQADTGWRDVTTSLINGWTASAFLIKRVQDTLLVDFLSLNGSAATSSILCNLPAGFQGLRTSYQSTHSGVLTIRSNGSVEAPAASWISRPGYVGFTTPAADPWPTTLPGTPA